MRVCKDCLKRFHGGAEKCCGHGWDLRTGKPIPGICSECGKRADELHCPDGPKMSTQ